MKKIVITGGPCSGKTTTIDLLATRGHFILPELAREIIAEELNEAREDPNYTPKVPWTDQKIFQCMVATRQWHREQEIPKGLARVFLDRGIVDGLAYAAVFEKALPGLAYELIAKTRYDHVFFLKALPYQRDAERREDPELAKRITQAIFGHYRAEGYNPILVPVMAPKDRVAFIEEEVLQWDTQRSS